MTSSSGPSGTSAPRSPLAYQPRRRLDDCHDALLAHPRPGSEADTGELLEALGVFDTAAYLSLTAAHPMPRTGNPTRYWTALVA
uniref:hypothetical protein n=1 Tax=Streptomyces sp. NRRL S-350 TaxID=1463902 RepID=UPI0004C263C9